MSFDYSATSFESYGFNNGDLTLDVFFDNFNSSGCQNQQSGQQFGWTIDIPDGSYFPSKRTFCESFVPESAASKLAFQAKSTHISSDNSFIDGILIDNVVLTCTSTQVQGIDVTELGQCGFSFQPRIGGTLNVLNFEWDFGDGNSSTEENPSHNYEVDGTYIVTLTLTDSRGCCTTVTTAVDCNNAPCLNYVCWDELQEMRFFEGFRLAGYPDLPFDNPILIEGNYHEIRDEMLQIMDNYPIGSINYGTFIEEYNGIDCTKLGYPVPGYFFLESPTEFVEFFGVDKHGNYLAIPFAQINCQ